MKGTKTLLSYILFIVGFQYKVVCNLPPRICEKDHFTCENKDCIPNYWKCDDTDDCGDDSDEADCPVSSSPADECDADEMQCKNGRCVTSKWKCDLEDDCGDNSDETNCTTTHQIRPCDESSNFRCSNGKCIPRSWTCNNIDDCDDNSDEATTADPHCIPFVGCKDGYFHCKKTGVCIHDVLVCDHNFNCGKDAAGVTDESDEVDCAKRTCEPGELKCDNGRCVSKQWKCDKQDDCGDGSDEKNCSIKACQHDEFKCGLSGHCINGTFRCDNFHDCLDGSDEKGCIITSTTSTTKLSSVTTTTLPYTLVTTKNPSTTVNPTKTYTRVFACKKDQYTCKSEHKCLHRSWLCDGEADCKGMDDESPEVCSTQDCQSDHFKCKNKKCVEERNRCDGHDHCGDNSDELNCKDPQVPCSSETHLCRGSHKCISLSGVCDKKKDCPYDDDESPLCGINECLKNNGNCSQVCRDLPIGFKCECRKGYELDTHSKKCVDINECHIFGKCSQACVNYKGSFACQCDQGYTIDPFDNRTCRAGGPMSYLLFTNRYDLREISSNGRESKLVAVARSASALAVSYAEKMLYWADSGLKTISRVLINGTGKPEVIVKNLQKPGGLALDWLGKKLYWTDTYHNRISVSNLDGSHSKVLHQGGDHEDIRAIEVYPEKGYLFWTNWGGHSKIERSHLDGSNKTTILSEGLIWPTALAIDKTTDRLYWTELSSICSVNIDGNGFKKIIYGLSRPYGLAVFEDNIYWTDFVERVIYKANKFNGRDKQKFNGSFIAPLDIAVFHPLVQTSVSHPCKGSNGGCSHLCFMMPGGKSVCACPGVMKLDPNKKTCTGPVQTTISTTQKLTTIVQTMVTSKATTTKVTKATTSQVTKATTSQVTKATTVTPKTKDIPKTDMKSTVSEVQTVKTEVSLKPIKNEKTVPNRTEIKNGSKPTEAVKTLLISTISGSVVVNQPQHLKVEKKMNPVYIVIAVVCVIALLVVIIFGVICLRRRRSQFDLSMVYESQRDVVHEKDEDKSNVETKYIIAPSKKTKTFENINFQNTDGAVRIPLNTSQMEGNMTDDYSASDNSSDDVCFDDSAPIMQNML